MREKKLLACLRGVCPGRAYRVSGAELERALHLSGTDLRKLVNKLRRKGIPIASDRQGRWGPHTSPTKWVAWGEEERRSGRAFHRKVETSKRSPRRRYAVNAGEVYATIRQLRQMSNGLEKAIAGLEGALESFGGEDLE